ncbi:Six-bladed beta-propeller TolB-like protein [Lasiodiplodia theobromae]|uniref:Six-bladed beta-propeller TolB-like protein n=1 Tax=Lasiodiplodia theobromae TaxID=45133 RepID=UPI0015C38674|nr:Six-bladed beta-propeller TolB-like protein [Lasiodiplodia theobromae]KAF4546813.1 Six-bladed beta-propeller TolB-like protein [Lasiodiplodia theobromae]KAF9632221.1 Six-bladed beta-propeller TolB-like protein [Lasiodiplodia theobromae]
MYPGLVQSFFTDLPSAFRDALATWAWVSYQEPSVAVLSGSFNRSAFDAPFESTTSDPTLQEVNDFLNTTEFIAYDERFFDIIGPDATVTHVQNLTYQTHEAPCFNPNTEELLFVEWGPPGGDDGVHTWQYLLNTRNNTLRKITTNPPTVNLHGCVFYNDAYYAVTDGSANETGALVKIDPITFEKTVLLNNYYQQPFDGFNDLEIDPDGNFWLTDSKSGAGRDIIPFTPPTNPTVYFVNATTMAPKPVHITTGNANGVAVARSPHDPSTLVLYLPDTGVSVFKPVSYKDPYGDRRLFAYDVSPYGGGVLTNPRMLNNPVAYFYDGIKVSKEGWIFVGAGDGVDVISPTDGVTLGTIRVGGGANLAVSMTLGEHELWIVGRGGVWHVKGIKETLAREW